MGWLMVNINGDSVGLLRNQSIEESDLLVRFFFDGERDVLINGVESVVEEVDCISMIQKLSPHNISILFEQWQL